jgi:hypothetical protein
MLMLLAVGVDVHRALRQTLAPRLSPNVAVMTAERIQDMGFS